MNDCKFTKFLSDLKEALSLCVHSTGVDFLFILCWALVQRCLKPSGKVRKTAVTLAAARGAARAAM